MRFPNAAKGVKKLFVAEIFYLIGVVFLGLGVLFAFFVPQDIESSAATALGLSMLISLSIGSVAMIVGMILKFIGVIRSSKDEKAFKGVLYMIVISLVLSVVSAFFSGNKVLTSSTDVFVSILSVISTVLIILGVCNMAMKLERADIVERGGKILKIIITLALLAILSRFIGIFLPKNIDDASTLAKVIVLTIDVLTILLNVAEYVLYIIFLNKAQKMLKES